MTTPPPGFLVIHGNRLEDLRDLTVALLQRQPLPPLVPETFLVQSNGMKHWLELALADEAALGICAGTRMELPAGFLWQAYRSVLGPDAVPEQMPFDKAALVWRLLRLLPELTQRHEVYQPLRHYLVGDADGRKAYQLALQVADVLDGYQSYRSDWLDDWAAGRDQLALRQGELRPLPPSQAWQAHLWRALQDDVGARQAQASRAAVHARFMRALEHWPEGAARPAGLPPRIVVFGVSSLPMQAVQALAALGRLCQVLMVVQNPCRYHWGHVVEGRELLRRLARHRLPAKGGGEIAWDLDDGELHLQAQPLLASWGKQGRDYLHLLDEFDLPEQYATLSHRTELFVDPRQDLPRPSQLSQLQADMLELEPLPSEPEELPDDGSIRLMMAHSAQREVEVLHDQLLAWFDADDTLQPRDVMVMVPDMNAFLPHIQAVFGRFVPGQSRHIPYSVADTSARQQPLVLALERLLGLPTSRVTLADWLSLFEVAAVRKRFGLGEADVQQLHDWLAHAGVRWGLDAAHRRHWGLPEGLDGVEQNSWAFGLRRMLLGYAIGDAGPWQEVLPLPEVGGLGAQLVGQLAEWVEAMNRQLAELAQPRPPAEWVAILDRLLLSFFDPADDAETRLLRKLSDQLQQWKQRCEQAGLVQPLPLLVVREHWLAQIETPGLQQRFFGGGVQFATLMPMRAIPFRVVCLLGMNDADYPRQASPRDFDLMTHSWRPGDRSRREDDRYLFLEALLSARERLYVSWQGRRASDNAELPPSVLVSQLQDTLAQRFRQPPRPQLQPLQAFSERYFQAGSGFFTYDADWQKVQSPWAAAPAGAVPGGTAAAELPAALALGELERLLRQPVEVYWRSRLGVHLEQPGQAAQEDEPFTLDKLAQYQLGRELLQSGDAAQALQRLALSGQLPMAAFGRRQGRLLQDKAELVRARTLAWHEAYPEALQPQSVLLAQDGIALSGTLHELRAGAGGWLQLAQRPGAVLAGKEGSRHPRHDVLTSLWVRHVLGCAMGWPLSSVMLGVDGGLLLPSLSVPQAQAQLRDWLDVYRTAWTQPLPLATRTALAWLRARCAGDPADDAEAQDEEDSGVGLQPAREAFEGGQQGRNRYAGEREQSAYLQRSFESFDDLADDLPRWAPALYGALVEQAEVMHGAQPSQDPQASQEEQA
ncbi:MAG: hypothetical protein RJA36_1146 [Pseudomonadota bacterium]